MNGRYRNMSGITNGMGRQYARSHDRLGQQFGVLRHFKSGQAAKNCESLLNLHWIASGDFIEDDLRDANHKCAPSIRPPFLRRLLVCSDKQVSTGKSNQITDERCFQNPDSMLILLRIISSSDATANRSQEQVFA